MPLGQKTKAQNRSNTVTNSIKTLKMAHLKKKKNPSPKLIDLIWILHLPSETVRSSWETEAWREEVTRWSHTTQQTLSSVWKSSFCSRSTVSLYYGSLFSLPGLSLNNVSPSCDRSQTRICSKAGAIGQKDSAPRVEVSQAHIYHTGGWSGEGRWGEDPGLAPPPGSITVLIRAPAMLSDRTLTQS